MIVRGYALLMVLMVLSLIALGLGTVMYVVDANLTSTRRILGETRCFYAVDSASRIASATVQAVSATLPPDSSPAAVNIAIADAMAAVCSIAGGCSGTPQLPTGLMPPGVTMEQFSIALVPTTGFRFVSTGPFRGVVIRETGMSVFIQGRDDGTGRECHVRDSFSTGTVSPFQFMMFATSPTSLFYARNNRGSPVPIYASGDLCIGGSASATLSLARVGAGGTLQKDGAPGCPPSGGSVLVNGVAFGSVDNSTSFENQQPRLAVPISSPPSMQGTNRIPIAAAITQVPTSRWLIDPVVPRADTQAEESLRIAGVADIRIIDGVWYVKRGGFDWPGMPIYSDHPGSVTPPSTSETAELLFATSSTLGNDKIGLDDVKAVLVAQNLIQSTDPWPPKKFSWYETDTSTPGALNDGGEGGAISYGALKRDAGGALVPGFYVGGSNTCGLGGTSLIAVTDGACSGAEKYRALAEASRSGFGDYNADSTASPGKAPQTKVAPINFDVARFIAALQDPTPGELGAYFTTRKFNGVVYITSTWKGQLNGLLSTSPSSFNSTLMPEQGPTTPNPSILGAITGKLTAPTITTLVLSLASTVQADQGFFLPFPLCGTGGTGNAYAPGFDIASCDGSTPFGAAAYGASDAREGARPNAVRVHSGANISALQPICGAGAGGELSKFGLSVVSNLPLYVQGDFNTTRRASCANFPRAMLAANTITVLSNAWDDDQNGWSDVVNAAFVPRAAAAAHSVDDNVPTNPTTTSTSMMLRAAILTHWTRPGAQSNEDLVRHLETYGAGTIAVRGALFAAGDSVFRNDTQETTTLGKPTLDFRYDTSYAQPSLQPAGIPKFLIGIAGKWKDTR